MAFLSRIGSLYLKSVSQNSNTLSISHVPRISILNAVRHIETSSRIFVGGLPWAIDDRSLEETFAGYGEVVDAKVMLDRETGRSRGFGFVSFAKPESASSAMAAMDGKEMNGRMLRVNSATEKPSFGSGGGYGGGGGFGGGYGSGYDGSDMAGGYGGGNSGGGGFGGGNSGGGGYGGGGGARGGYGGDEESEAEGRG